MKEFLDENFLLSNAVAMELYHQYAKEMPIFDFHCHLSPKEIWEDRKYNNIAEVWLGGDHYKWRQMRSMGISEEFITGSASDYDKFMAWAKCVPYLIGNPLYHWTHLELQRFFSINDLLNEKTAPEIWEKTSAMLQKDDFTTRNLIERSNVFAVCTTDDPSDSLIYHKKIKEEGKMKTKVVPAMRPDKALQPEAPGFGNYMEKLFSSAGMERGCYKDLKIALSKRIEFFDKMGCKACDHAFNYIPYEEADDAELERIYQKGIKGESLSVKEQDQYKTDLLIYLAKEYKAHDWAMELHIGALRNNNPRMYRQLGADTGFDSVNDFNYAPALAKIMGRMDSRNELPKTILFTLNPKDNYVLSTIMGCFQQEGYASKIQMGSAWWFMDHKDGMEEQMLILGNTGLLSKFIGMVTDSRSFLSYPRHEYFRRIVCNMLGMLVEDGEYPAEMDTLGRIIQDICFNNAKAYIPIA